MASYLAPTINEQFSQYIPTVDAEAYVKVGLQKQQQYDENVKKIQAYRQSVASLPVGNEADSQYLKQKVTDLDTQLNSMSKSDFSQSQVLDQASSLISQLSNDKIIQTAVTSAMNAQSYEKSKEKAYEAGKGSIKNDYYTDRYVNQWRNAKTPGQSLGSIKYVPYFDDLKGFQDFIKDIHPNIVIEQQPLTNNEDGTPNWKAYALVEDKKTEISKDRILELSQLYYQQNAQAAQQLDVNSTYFADHTDDASVLKNFQESSNRTIELYNKQISDLEEKKNTSNGSSSDIDNQIGILRTKLNTFQSQVEQSLKNPESLKKETYNQSLFAGLADRFYQLDFEKKIVDNPILKNDLAERRFKFDQEKENTKNEQWKEDYNLKLKDSVNKSTTSGGELSTGPAKEENVSLFDISNRVNTLRTSAISDINSTLSMTGINTNNLTDDQKIAKIEQLHEQYLSDPMGVDPNLREYFSNPTDANSGYGKLKSYYSRRDLVNDANSTISKLPESNEIIATIAPSNLKGGEIKLNRTQVYNITSLEKQGDVNKLDNYLRSLGSSYDAYKSRYWVNPSKNIHGLAPINVSNSIEIENIRQGKNPKNNSKISEIARSITDANPIVKESYSTEGDSNSNRGKEILGLISQVADEDSKKQIGEINSKSKKGGVILSGVYDPLTGQTSVVITSYDAPSNQTNPIPISASDARRWFPTITASDPVSVLREQLRYKNVTDAYSPVDFNKGVGLNLKNYSIRAKFARTAGGSYYTILEYKDKTNPNVDWSVARKTNPTSSIEEQIKVLNNYSALSDSDFKNQILSN